MTGLARLSHAGFEALAAPFLARGILEEVDVQTVDLLARRAGVAAAEGEALLGLAFAIRAPRQGSAGVDLATLAARLSADDTEGFFRGSGADERADDAARRRPLPWPNEDRWLSQTMSLVRLVGGPDLGDARPFAFDGSLLLTRRYARYQRALATALAARSVAPLCAMSASTVAAARHTLAALFPHAEGRPLDRQRLAVAVAASRTFSVICGGPGTGKTHTVRALLRTLRTVFRAEHGRDPEIALAAPTGKAAVRLHEALGAGRSSPSADDLFLASLVPTTVHRLLRPDHARPTRFRHDEEDPLRADVVIVDEASMVDLALMTKLVAAVRPEARFVLLGDHHQLASVEAGCVLRDLTDDLPRGGAVSPALFTRLGALSPDDAAHLFPSPAADPRLDGVVELVSSFRTREGSALAELVRGITIGTPAALGLAEKLLGDATSNGGGSEIACYPHQYNTLSAQAETELLAPYQAVQAAVVAGLGADGTLPEAARGALALLDDFRVLSPHRLGVFGVRGLNEHAIRALRPEGSVGPLFLGMPVLVTESGREVGLFNGDVGVCVEGPDGSLRVAFRRETAALGVVFVDPQRLPRHEPGFALTVHKSQGSQYRRVMLVLPERRSRIVTRELLYTALTRARERFVLAGDTAVFRAGLEVRLERASSLRELLRTTRPADPDRPR